MLSDMHRVDNCLTYLIQCCLLCLQCTPCLHWVNILSSCQTFFSMEWRFLTSAKESLHLLTVCVWLTNHHSIRHVLFLVNNEKRDTLNHSNFMSCFSSLCVISCFVVLYIAGNVFVFVVCIRLWSYLTFLWQLMSSWHCWKCICICMCL